MIAEDNAPKKKRTKIGIITSTDQLLRSLDGPLPLVLKFLDPGLDWTSCRLVCRTWHFCIVSIDKEPGIWMAPLRPNNVDGWNERLRSDLANVRPTTASERQRWLQAEAEDFGDEDEGEVVVPEPSFYQLWRRTDVTPNEYGMCIMNGDWETRPPIVSARLMLCLRGVRELVDARDKEWHSEVFSFAGSWWYIIIGANHREWMDGNGGWRFGLQLRRCVHAPSIKNKQHRDPTEDDINDQISNLIRYQASFTAGANTFRAGDFNHSGPVARRFQPSCTNEGGCYVCEYFPLSIAEFALGPPPACPDLRISIELEQLGYGYDVL